MTPGLTGHKRFDVLRPLGRGGMGVVFEVFDREQGTSSALKLLPEVTPRALSLFKHEFRALQGLRHPNLITLGELLSEGDHWFFTMELVRGVDFLSWVRGVEGPPPSSAPAPSTLTLQDDVAPIAAPAPAAEPRAGFDEARLRAALRQLAEGLRFLHDAGKVHRDVKPSNVLVTPEGRVVILDFGLVADRAGPAGASGTPAFMAPERAEGGPAGPAADLYAVGVMLFAALTGERPFSSCSAADLLLRRSSPAPRPGQLAPGLPRDLDELCVQLLDPAPAARPSARDVLARLGASAVPGAPEPALSFVGRRRELEAMVAAYQESRRRPVLVALEGPSSIGKTALLAALLAGLRGRDEPPLVLSGRCYEHEGIPYKAIDGVMDELGEHLASAPDQLGGAIPADAPLLGVLFPVLRRARGFDAARSGAGDALQMRRDAEQAGRALFRALAARRPLVVSIDDFQWADADSMTFLAALARAPDAPPCLVVLSSRVPVTLPFEGERRRIALEPLPPDDARELAERLVARAGTGATMDAEAIAREAGGNPLFINELAWRPAAGAGGQGIRLEEVLWDKIRAHPGAAGDVLELVAVAAAPVTQQVVADAAGLDAASFARAADALRAERLIRSTGLRSTDSVEAYHDRIRETVVARLGPAARAGRHLRLAAALERHRPDDLDALVTHFAGGGDAPRAGAYAVRAGDRARAALAFERAAAFYRRAIELQSEAQGLHVKLADSLANAGMGADAAAAYQRAAEHGEREPGLDPAPALELRRRAAEHLLSSGRLEEGLTALRAILARVRVRTPGAAASAFASMLFHRARVRLRGLSFVERPASGVAPPDLLRADTLWAAAARLGAIDPIRAADFQARHLLLCLALGEPFRVARALLAEAAFNSMGGPRRWARTEALLSRAGLIASRIDHPYATALQHFAAGLADYQSFRYAAGLAGLERAAELFRTTCTGTSHEVALSSRFAIDILFNLGELREMARRVRLLLEDAERRGDLYLAAELRTGPANAVWLFADEPGEARRAAELGIARWPQRSFYLQHYYHAFASAQISLYTGDGEGAHRIAEEAWTGLRKGLLLQIQAVRTEALCLRARAAIACGRRGALEVGRRAVAKLDPVSVPAVAGLAAAARAGLSARRGDAPAAIPLLRDAGRAFDAAGMGMHAAACRLQLARLDRGAASAGEADAAAAWMRNEGVVRPERLADLLVPGMPA